MSKERAQRRASRAKAEEAQRRARAREVARAGRRRSLLGRLTALAPRRRSRPSSILAQRRRRQNLALVAVLVVLHILLWTQVPGWGLRATAAILTVLLWPVLVTVAFDRRSST